MSLKSEFELLNTRTKLRELEKRFDELQDDPLEDARVRELTMRSLKRLINQLKEEIALFEIHQLARR